MFERDGEVEEEWWMRHEREEREEREEKEEREERER